MLNQSIITTENIVAYLKDVTQETSISEEEAEESSTASDLNGAIPGIPANAMKGGSNETIRKFSLVPMQTQHINLEDLESGTLATIACKSKPKTSRWVLLNSWYQIFKRQLSIVLNAGVTQIILLIATVIALVASDMNLIFGNKGTDFGVEIVIFVVFVIFIIELIASILCVPKYAYFFLWLDLAATISLLLEIDFLLESGSSSTSDLALAKASRAAKIGAKAGR